MSEESYDAEVAGLHASVSGMTGLSIQVRGFNDKLHILLRKYVDKFRSLEVKADRFAVFKEKVWGIMKLSCRQYLLYQ